MTQLRQTILILGASSFVGSNLAEFLKKDFRVVGTYKHNPVSIPGVLTLPCDVLVKEEVQMVIGTIKPNFVLYCAGLSSLTDCKRSPEYADALNTIGVFNASENCQRYKAQFIHFTSCHVFGGENRDYLETDIPDSNSVYGKTNASAEFFIQKNNLNYLLFRCCKFYGRSIHPRMITFMETLERKTLLGEGMLCDSYVHTGFLDVMYLGIIVKLAIEKKVSNRLFHLSSKEIMNHYDFAKLYAKAFHASGEIFSKGRWPFPAFDSSIRVYAGEELFYKLNVQNIEGYFNIALPSVEESLAFTYKRLMGAERAKRSSGSVESVRFI